MTQTLSFVGLWLVAFGTGLSDGFLLSPLDDPKMVVRLGVTKRGGGGGRAPGALDNVGEQTNAKSSSTPDDRWRPTPCRPEEARLTVVQITDTYTLEHLPSVKTLLQDIRSKAEGSTVISCMTEDFLAPYLLSSVDRGTP